MNSATEILKTLLRSKRRYSEADLLEFLRHYSRMTDSAFLAEVSRVKRMFLRKKTADQALTPPAGLKAKQAVPVILAYAREETGDQIKLSREEQGSLSAVAEALDRRFGEGFTARVIRELNAMPNGATNLHYKS